METLHILQLKVSFFSTFISESNENHVLNFKDKSTMFSLKILIRDESMRSNVSRHGIKRLLKITSRQRIETQILKTFFNVTLHDIIDLIFKGLGLICFFQWYAISGPRANTVTDFWTMAWQEDICQVVMLTNLTGEGKVCHFWYLFWWIIWHLLTTLELFNNGIVSHQLSQWKIR